MTDPQRTSWYRFLRAALLAGVAALTLLLVLIVVVDPHDHLVLSPPLKRAPVNTNQRYSYTAIARNPVFDSVVLGTSSIRLLRPEKLDPLFDASFANLAMNAATPYEQSRILELFLRHHRAPGAVIIGLDITWCQGGENASRYTFREFPEWLYDENPWNDFLHLLNPVTLEQTGRQIRYLLGQSGPRYGLDGFENFLEANHSYDAERALELLYGPEGRRPKPQPVRQPPHAQARRDAMLFPAFPWLEKILAGLPTTTSKVMVFVPTHYFSQEAAGTGKALRWDECKHRVTELAERFHSSHVLDFRIDSAITREDNNYWDPDHYDLRIGDRLAELIADGVRQRRGQEDLFVYLGGFESGVPDRAGRAE